MLNQLFKFPLGGKSWRFFTKRQEENKFWGEEGNDDKAPSRGKVSSIKSRLGGKLAFSHYKRIRIPPPPPEEDTYESWWSNELLPSCLSIYIYIYTRENQIAVIDEASEIKREINSSIQKNPSFRRKRKEKELLFSSPRKRKKEKGLRKEKEKIGRFAQYSTIALRPHRWKYVGN